MAKELMIMAAAEAREALGDAMEKILRAEHLPDQVSREVINKHLSKAMDSMNTVNNWLHAIANVR